MFPAGVDRVFHLFCQRNRDVAHGKGLKLDDRVAGTALI